MIKQKLDYEFIEDLNEEDLNKVASNLDCYVVEIPSEFEINNTIEKLREFVPGKKVGIKRNRIFELFEKPSNEIGFMSSTYWLVSIMIFILGTYSICMNGGSITTIRNPYISAVLLAPVPFIFGIIEIFKGREEGVIELELSCKTSIGEIMLSRVIIICIYNILLNTVLSIVLVHFNSGILFWRITLMWLAPFTVVSGIGLILVNKMRGSYVAVIFTSVWIVFVMAMLTQKRIMDRIIGINLIVYIVLAIIGSILMIIQIKRYSQRGSSFFERSVLNEVKN